MMAEYINDSPDKMRRKRLNKKQKTCAAVLSIMALFAVTGMSRGPDEGLFNWLTGRMLFNPKEEEFQTSRSLSVPYDTATDVALPPFMDTYADVWLSKTIYDQPFFWYVPRAGGSTLLKIFTHCLHMVTAGGQGVESGSTLTVQTQSDGGKYLNVDLTTTTGIERAKTLQAVESRTAHVVSSQHFYASSTLFDDTTYRGRVFVMLRHPVKRAVAQFYYLQRATWEPSYDTSLATMSLQDYALSEKHIPNFVVRSLVHLDAVEVTEEHVELAKEILRRKVLVGIMEWFDVSVVRFEKYFGWWDEHNVMRNHTVNNCHYSAIRDGDHVGTHPTPDRHDDEFTALAVRNWADIELYQYAKILFTEQAKLVST